MASTRFRSGGRVYETAALDEITPRDLLTFPRDASAVMGRPIVWTDIEKAYHEIEALPEGEQELHPDFFFLTTVLIWVSRRAAGDKLTYDQCLDESFEFLPEPKDHKPNPTKAAAKRKKAAKKAAAAPVSETDAEPAPA